MPASTGSVRLRIRGGAVSDFSNFRADYDELTDEVNRARHQFLSDHLTNWFEHIDDTPQVADVVRRHRRRDLCQLQRILLRRKGVITVNAVIGERPLISD